jgi:DNA-binding NarL/FixJ family response regulator
MSNPEGFNYRVMSEEEAGGYEPITLSPFQRDIVQEMCKGKVVKEIATELGRSRSTIKNSLYDYVDSTNIYELLGVGTSAEAVWTVLEKGIVDIHNVAAGIELERINSLNDRERKFFTLITDKSMLELSLKQIGEEMGYAYSTVKNCASDIYSKLGIRGREQAIVFDFAMNAAADAIIE